MYIVYKTINITNDKFYIGVHRLNSARRYYLGSGLRLRRAIIKYGIENFKRETLFEFSTKDEAYLKERELVTSELLNNSNCYNLAFGGNGGNLGEVSNSKKRGDLNGMRKIPKESTPCFGRTGSKHPLFGKSIKDFMTETGRLNHSRKIRQSKLDKNNVASRKVIDTLTGTVYDTIKQAATSNGINYSTMCARVNGRLKSCKRFRYAD